MSMYLYHFTLQKPSAITHAIYGNFSAPKAQEIIIARGKILELLRPDDNGKVQTVLSVEIFGIIRSIQPFRLTGSNKDFIVIGSDSGRIVILEYNPEKNVFDKIHQETYGRSGCRRIVPGQYLAIDPKGRAVMIAAVEKQKFVYILNRDSTANLTISSPLEAHKAHSIVLDVCGLDVGFENPLFGCLELDYEDCDQDPTGEAIKNTEKHLTFYELDLGLNHVVRQSSEPVPRTANFVVAVPGGADGPGGLLVACQDYVYHRTTDHEDKFAKIPRRRDIPRTCGLMLTSWVLVKQRDWFFFLCQSEYGDLYKVSLDYDEDGSVNEVKVKYFDTVPVAVSLAVLKTGFMFVAVESGNHVLYQFQAIGDGDDDETFQIQGDDEHIYFKPRALRNLLSIDEMQSAMPITDLLVENLFKDEETPQIFAACGRGYRSSLRILRHGIAVTERAVSTLPGIPSAVWSIKTHINDEHDKYIIVSFKDATMVLSIGETVEEIHDSGFLGTAPTLHTSMFGDDALIQIHPDGIRHIRADRRIQEWQAPGKRIMIAAVNERQVVALVGTNELIYFELDTASQVVEIEKRELDMQVVALGIAPVPGGRQRARFLAVATVDNRMRIYSLGPTNCLQSLSMLMLPSRVVSLRILEMASLGGTSLYVNMGTTNGVIFRATLDKVTGQLSDNRARYLGAKQVKLFNVTVNGSEGILALSSRSWLCYNYQGRFRMMPLSYVPLEFASSFHSEQCPEGIVSIAGDSLRIFTTEQLGDMFNQTSIPLRYTPRKMFLHPQTKHLLVLESDNDTYPYAEKQRVLEMFKKMDGEDPGIKVDGGEGVEEEDMPESVFGVPRPGSGKWASCLRILDVPKSKTLDLLELDNNETAVCLGSCAFQNKQGELFLCVGTVKDLVFEPKRMCSEGYIHVYRLLDNGTKFQLQHKTAVQDIPGALCDYNGRLLVGVGPILRIYDLGKRKLLRKCESKKFPNHIISIWTSEDKIIVGDVQQSYHFVKYNRADNILYIFADDCIPRWLTSGCLLDATTIAAGDKFGNVFVLRLPDKVNQQLEEDPTGGTIQWNTKDIAGAPYKLDMLINFYVGETVTKVIKTTITPGGNDIILYATIFGTVGAFLPFSSREDIDFFTNLEMHMRTEFQPLCGRDHLSFRSYYAPCRNVVDGDLCEQYPNITAEQQKTIADGLIRSPGEVQKKLEEMRNSI